MVEARTTVEGERKEKKKESGIGWRLQPISAEPGFKFTVRNSLLPTRNGG